ncbi:NAD(P)/FAD-dependent oxidoreductase [Pseudaquabacterium rugosum]|uniref:NAD(P)/FAD-dependent oxidoreductase n=1 Tax=Pseudaquabacterium rugosum TaxID=2984194 RepID=A0ABU9B904_9BURK
MTSASPAAPLLPPAPAAGHGPHAGPGDPPPTALPPSCEVLVVGAGPAGSACAQALARRGHDVLLIDEQAFPRDKVCGDGLIPDAHAALHHLGVHEEVMARARRLQAVTCIAPRGGQVDVPGQLAVLPRRVLDDILCRAAVRAGARFAAPWRWDGPLLDEAGRVCGARLSQGGRSIELPARWTVLATGARPRAMLAAGLCERQTPSAMAVRTHVRHPELAGRLRTLQVVWHPRLRGGYGWVFPGPDDLFNVGVGLSGSHSIDAQGRARMADVNLRDVMQIFGEVHADAGRLLREGEVVAPLKGAPLRCSLDGARWGRPGLLATGEAVGSTYAFTGEGIGKAMETGLLAAAALHGALAAPHDRASASAAADAGLLQDYAQRLQALQPRFALYRKADRISARPWLADLLIWRARRSPGIRRRMAEVLDETRSPDQLITLRGLFKLMLPLR